MFRGSSPVPRSCLLVGLLVGLSRALSAFAGVGRATAGGGGDGTGSVHHPQIHQPVPTQSGSINPTFRRPGLAEPTVRFGPLSVRPSLAAVRFGPVWPALGLGGRGGAAHHLPRIPHDNLGWHRQYNDAALQAGVLEFEAGAKLIGELFADG